MAGSGLLDEELKDGVLNIWLNRPQKLNALVEPMRSELLGLIEAVRRREEVRVCVLRGRGRGFCAGGDIDVMKRIIEDEAYDEVQRFLELGKGIVEGLRSLPCPVIASIHGPAAGAGMNLALACDYRIASVAATFGQTFVNIGLHPDWGGTYFLPRLLGPSRALELFWTGRLIDAAEALSLGLVDRVVPAEELDRQVEDFARALAGRPRAVLALTKRGVYQSLHEGLDAALRHEASAQARCLRSREARAGIGRFLKARQGGPEGTR